MAQNETHFTVGCWSGTYHVPRKTSDLRGLQIRLDEIISEQLGLVCQSFLEEYLNGADSSVWRVRDLSLNFSIDAGFADAHSVARDWGRSLASEVLSIVEGEEVNDSVLRFPNRAAYLAQFLSDLASSLAWGKWYYEEFSDLQVLSIRQAICSIFLRKEASAADLLLRIASTGHLESVLSALNEEDARLIFDICFDSAPSSSRPHNLQKWAGIVVELWNSALLRAGSHSANRFRDALRLLARTLSRHPAGEGDLELQAVIHGLLELRPVLLQIRKPCLMESLFERLAAFDLQSATEIAARCGVHNPKEALSFFAQLMQGDVTWAQQAAGVVLSESNTEKFLTSTNIRIGESFLSPFGGIFLLGPSLINSSLDGLARYASDSCESPDKTAAVLRHLAAVKCFGGNRFAETSGDPALRLFSGMEALAFTEVLQDVNAGQLRLADAHDALLQSLSISYRSHEPLLFADLVSLSSDRSVLILHELAHDEWLDAVQMASYGDDALGLLQSSLQGISTIWKLGHPVLFLGESLSSQIDMLVPRQTVENVRALHRMDDRTEENLASQLGLTRRQLTYRLESAKQHFKYFSLAASWPGFELNPSLDCLFTLISRAALRQFSRKLFGFESSSPNHIYENFLSGIGEIRRVSDHLEVRLPQSPLSMILRMAGLQDQKYVLPWLKGMEVWLLPPQE